MSVDDRDQIARRGRTGIGGPAHDDLIALRVLAHDLYADLSPRVHPQRRKLAHRVESVPKARGTASAAALIRRRGRRSDELTVAVAAEYPTWKFYPSRSKPPAWVTDVVAAFAAAGAEIDSRANHGVTSDAALAAVRPGLVALGFDVESGKTRAGRIHRPVLFGEMGRPRVAYEIDGFHSGHGIVVEVEAGRGASNNAAYRDLVRTSLIVDADYLVLAMMLQYTAGTTVWRSYERTREQIDAIYESERLRLPFRGVLLIGY